MAEKCWASSREGIVVDPFGDITVPAKPRSWSQHRYYSTYDEDPMTLWVLRSNGDRTRYTVRGPLSARTLIRSLRAGDVHLIEWGRTERPGPARFPAELVERASRPTG